MEYKELVMVNKDCDRKNRFFNIVGWTEQQILDKIAEFPKDKWLALKR